ncbi:MAG: dihydroorotate dehydrogenase [Acidobacteria bacterium]|nr:dihydroorotate dehydrogenase [Acidobacteriota bacterium]
MANLEVQLCGLRLKNPILAASGTFGYGVELDSILDLDALGGFVTKGLSREPIAGNPAPRIVEAASGMINSIGLQNVGVERFVAEKLPKLRTLNTAVFANVFGYAPEDYVAVLERLEDQDGLAGYELNVSCPNTKHGGLQFGADPQLLGEVVGLCRKAVRSKRPMMVKLSPNVGDIAVMARAGEAAGADALSLVNTFQALAVDARTRKPRIGAGFGGLSGPAIKPIALRMVYQASRAVQIPVVGLGGIAGGEDVAEFLVAGAAAVEVGTASFWDPAKTAKLPRELDRFLREAGVAAACDLIGTLQMGG